MDTPELATPQLLLALFAEFHDEVTRLRGHAQAGTLPAYLAQDGAPGPTAAEDQARAVSARLAGLLLEQNRRVRRRATEAQLRACRAASYVMAAVADEVFIFGTAWPGSAHWLSCLLEHRLFGSRVAGKRFFDIADDLLATPGRNPLQCDLSSCLLLALQLGFRGMHRGPAGSEQLQQLRRRLWRFVSGEAEPAHAAVPFPQAGEHTVITAHDPRIAPLRPWLVAAGWWLGGFAAVSSLLWIAITQPLLQLPGM